VALQNLDTTFMSSLNSDFLEYVTERNNGARRTSGTLEARKRKHKAYSVVS
jgi:hypothetical protein